MIAAGTGQIAVQEPTEEEAFWERARFERSFVSQLPGEQLPGRASRLVQGACFSLIDPEPASDPSLVIHAPEVASLLGLTRSECDSATFARLFAGNLLLPGMVPYAACYAGHQFGSWTSQLGDGRVITLGELRASASESWEVQLKGAGRTPYSRAGDGRAALRSCLREFLASEAMHHLGVPTTRALCVVRTGDQVVRDMFYDGKLRAEPGAVVCRVARSFLRFGSYELFAARGDLVALRRLLDFTIQGFFPELSRIESQSLRYAALFVEVCRRTALLMAHWMRVGFVHGVMNTDNMSILGLTLDYGPFGFLEEFAPDFTPNTSDDGRYRFANQPRVAKWNLLKLAEALHPVVESARLLQDGLACYTSTFEQQHYWMQIEKLGLRAACEAEERRADQALLDELARLLALLGADHTLFYRALAGVAVHAQAPHDLEQTLRATCYGEPNAEACLRLSAWLQAYASRCRARGVSERERRRRMNAVNPKYVLRNFQAQLVIEAAERGETAPALELLELLRRPYDEQPANQRFAERRPAWANDRPGCTRLSCSS